MGNNTQAALNVFTKLGVLDYQDNCPTGVTSGGTVQGNSIAVPGEVNRYPQVAASSTVMLPSLLTGEAPRVAVIINEGANALTVFPYVDSIGHAESINGSTAALGTTSGGLSVASGGFAVLVPEGLPSGRGGVAVANLPNWVTS